MEKVMKILFFVLIIVAQSAFCGESQRKFRFNGIEYKNIEEFWKSEDGMEILAERKLKKLREEYESELAEQRHKENIRSLSEWKSGRYPDVFRREDERVQYLYRKSMGEAWWIRHKEPHIFDEKAPSYQIVAKVAKKYGISQREAWEKHSHEINVEFEKTLKFQK